MPPTFYAQQLHDQPRAISDAPPEEAEVAIVGAGFAGLHTALGLQARGVKSIAILDAEHVGYGASGRNGGFVFSGFSLGEAALSARLGTAGAKRWYQRTVAAVGRIRALIHEHRIECDLVDAGVLWCNWFQNPAALRARQQLLANTFDTHWQWLDYRELSQRIESKRYSSALFEREALHLQPLKLARGLAEVLRARGATLSEGARVLDVQVAQSGYTLELRYQQQPRRLRAKQVVLCCGGYLQGELARRLPKLRRALLPIATYVMNTEPLGERLSQVLRTQAAVYDSRFAFDYYRALPDTRLLWGGRIHVLDASPKVVAQRLRSDMLRVFPQLSDVRIEHAWSGLMSYARHEMPQFGQLTPGLWYAQAFGGHGMAPTAAVGEALAAAIAEQDLSYQELEQFGLSRTFGALGLAAAQLQYWRFQGQDAWRDRLEQWRGADQNQ